MKPGQLGLEMGNLQGESKHSAQQGSWLHALAHPSTGRTAAPCLPSCTLWSQPRATDAQLHFEGCEQ